MKERRQDRRIKSETLVHYNVLNEGKYDEGIAKTLDISQSGMHLEMQKNGQPGDRLNLTVSHQEELVELEGKTVWSAGGKSGIQMIDPPNSYNDFLKKIDH